MVQARLLRRARGEARRGHELLAPAVVVPARGRADPRLARCRRRGERLEEDARGGRRHPAPAARGSSFGDAISGRTNVFPGYYIAVVRAAELTGHLDDALEQLSVYLEREAAARRELKSALTYPTIVFCLAIVAVVIMSVYVLPKFKGFYTGLGAKLPLPTRMLLGFTDFMTHWWPAIAGGIVAVALMTFALIGGKHGKARRDDTASAPAGESARS